jgi:hypothetical protein
MRFTTPCCTVAAAALAAALLLAAPAAWAQSQTTISDGAAFGSACAGIATGTTGHAGDALGGDVCQVAPTPGTVGATINASASASGVNNGMPYSNSGAVTAAPQIIHVQASNTGSPSSQFPGGAANGGWNENFLLTGGAIGTDAVWIIPIHVTGELHAHGNGARGQFNVEAYKNHGAINGGAGIQGAAYDQYLALNPGDCPACPPAHHGDTEHSWDYETVFWTVTDRTADPLVHNDITVDLDIFFAVPFIWGTTFEMGFYAQAFASETSQGGVMLPVNTTDVLFQHTIYWNGPGYVQNWNGSSLDPAHITDFNIDASGGSGANYNHPFAAPPDGTAPEPGTIALLGFALAGLGLIRRRAA